MSNNRFTKLSKKKIIKNIPNNRDGSIGDLQIVEIPQKGTFLCIKDKDGWKISDGFKPRHKFNINEFDKITISEAHGKSGKVFSLGTETISYTVNTNPGTATTTSFNKPILKVGNGTNSGVVSSLGSKNLVLKSGNSSPSQIIIGAIDISADMSGVGTFNIRYNNTGATAGEFSMMNVAAGDCYQNIQVTNAAKDPYTRYTYYADDPSNNIQWSVGMDGSDSDNAFKINYNASATALTPSNGTNVFKITDAGNVSIAGTLTVTTINADTAGDNYLVEVSGEVKKRTPAETLADIGAQATVTAGTNCTFSGATLNVDDAFIKNDASDTMAGSLTITGGDIDVAATQKIYFDGGTDTYITENSADVLRIVVGNDTMIQLSEKGDDGNEVSFGSSCAGFTQLEPTYDATATIVDFRHSNKQNLTFGAGSITHLLLYFPLVSGNFQLLIKQDGTGSRTITNYKVYEFDESVADGEAGVKFAGGSNPTLTTDANHVDILSFYWDADNEIAYGVATLDFQF